MRAGIKHTHISDRTIKETSTVMEEAQGQQTPPKPEETSSAAESNSSSPEAMHIAALESQLMQARQEATENWNKFLRERADMENFRKRQERNLADRVQQQKKALLHKLLGVMDNVERALNFQDTLDRQGLQQALR